MRSPGSLHRGRGALATTPALRAWASGRPAPFALDGVRVMRAAPSSVVVAGSPVSQTRYHLIAELAVAWDQDGRPTIGARWTCGASSVAADVYRQPDLDRLFGAYGSPGICPRCAAARDGDNGPCVYRVWDKSRTRLLYIGSTGNWISRRAQHRRDTWWWAVAVHIDLTAYATLDEARKAEAAAIRMEKPRMNVAHNREQAAS